MNIGIIGFGYWGPNLVRNFSSLQNCKVSAIAEANATRHELIKKQYRDVKIYLAAEELIKDNLIDAVVIATPVFSHYPLAKLALESGKHVLIEKPMTSSSRDAIELIEIAEQKKISLMVDHTFLYTGAVQKMKELVTSNALGKLSYIDSTRINLGLFQPDINVLWDLAPHDISILNYLVDERPISVNATGVSHTNNDIENIAYLTLNYNSGFIAHFNCSWSSPVKIRMMLIGGSEKMCIFNDIEPTEKIKVYDTSYSYKTDEEKRKILVDYRAGDIYLPKVNSTEALSLMAQDFVDSIINNTVPKSDAKIGLDVVKILEAAQKSIKNKGQEIKIEQ
jgi:predicted dehydrogenase